MMPAAKHFDVVMGVDIHIIMIPTPVGPVPTPLPNPFIGMVLDVMDYIPILGATVMVNGMPRAQAGTEAKAMPPHLPLGGPFLKPPANEGEMFMGSSTVLVEGEPFTYLGLPVLTCNDIGVLPPPRFHKKKVPKTMVLPVSVVLPIPGGPPVLVGGPPTISLMGMAMKAGFAALGKLKKLKRVEEFIKKSSDKIQEIAGKAMRKVGIPDGMARWVHRKICSVTGHPVDIASGNVFTEIIDFSLPGPIPLEWERVWFSVSNHERSLGYGWHHRYDMAITNEKSDDGQDIVILRMADGRPAIFNALAIGESEFNRSEKLYLFRNHRGYYVRDKDRLLYFFEAVNSENSMGLESHKIWQKLTSVENLNGHSIQFKYDPQGALMQITDSAARTLEVKTDSHGRIAQIIAPHPGELGRTFPLVSYYYDETGNLVDAKDALGQSMQYAYKNHLLVRETNRNGLNFYFDYNGTDLSAKCFHTWGDGGIYDHKLYFHEGYTVVENSLGFKTTHYHRGGLVYKKINTKGGITLKNYSEDNDLLVETDPMGRAIAYEYDERANVVSVIHPDGSTLSIRYNDLDLPIALTDQVGGEWIMNYDEKGNLIRKTNSLKESSRLEYLNGFPVKSFLPNGAVTEFNFDSGGNLLEIKTADQHYYRQVYDFLGNRKKTIDPNGNVQEWVFDLLGRVIRVNDPDGNVQKIKYDGESNVIKATDLQYDVAFEYAGMNKLKARIQNNTRIEFKYNTEENLLGIINEFGYAYRFELDSEGEVISESGFDELKKVYERDLSGLVTIVKRPGNKFSQFQYDPMGRVTAVLYSDGNTERYGYRQDGLMQYAQNHHDVVRFERDLLGRVVKETSSDCVVESSYDVMGFRKGLSSSFGADISFERNLMGDLESVGSGDFSARFTYDVFGLELERKMSGGVNGSWRRDALGRPLQHLTGGTAAQQRVRNYTWEVNNRLKEIHDSQTGQTKFEHDAFGNLIAAVRGDGKVELRLADAVGNLFRTRDKSDRKYGPAGQLLSSEGKRYEYDPEGNLSKKYESPQSYWHYTWNDAGMMEKVTRPNGVEITFSYDALGRRLTKKYGQVLTRWAWDGNKPLHEWKERVELSEAERFERTNENARNGATTWIFEEDSFTPLGKVNASGSYTILGDHLGTPMTMFDQAGGSVWSADLNIYGEIQNLKGSREDCPFRYQGQYEDVETGLYYNRFRYYAPNEGFYVSNDPLGLASGELNAFRYVNDTNLYIDQFGLEKCGLSAADRKKMGDAPAGMINPHRHHIVREKIPPGWKNKEARKAIRDSQAILKKHGIDKNTDIRNFTWAQNGAGAHSQKAAMKVAEKLRVADKSGKAAVEAALESLGDNMTKGVFF